MDERTTDLHELAQRIADGEPLEPEFDGGAALGREALLRLSRVAGAFRELRESQPQAAPPRPPPLFRWGPLEVEAQIARGAYGVVHRAYDPTLARAVALKLAPDALARGSDGRRFLDEAKRLARLRHPHVVAVYGAARHDGVPGFWTEWIDGDTLERYVERNGPLAPAEAWAVLRDLAAALDFVHARGVIHGDLKPANVLRERGGRVVLTDFGAGGDAEELASRITLSATRAYLAPEVAGGAVPDAGSDRYALAGVVVYLLTGLAPEPGMQALATRQPPLAEPLRAQLARALANDPAARFDSAAALIAALGQALDVPRHPLVAARARRARIGSLVALGLALLLALTAMLWPKPWNAEAGFRRYGAGPAESLADGAEVALGDRLGLQVRSDRPVWVYVVNEDDAGTATLLFPLRELDASNPLPAVTIELPGTRGGVSQHWQVSSDGGREAFLVLLAAQPLPEVERLLGDWRRASESAPRQRAVQGLALADSRGLAIEGERLRELAQALSNAEGDGRELRVYRYLFR